MSASSRPRGRAVASPAPPLTPTATGSSGRTSAGSILGVGVGAVWAETVRRSRAGTGSRRLGGRAATAEAVEEVAQPHRDLRRLRCPRRRRAPPRPRRRSGCTTGCSRRRCSSGSRRRTRPPMMAYHGAPPTASTTTAMIVSELNDGNVAPFTEPTNPAYSAPKMPARNAEMQNTRTRVTFVVAPSVSSASGESRRPSSRRPRRPRTIATTTIGADDRGREDHVVVVPCRTSRSSAGSPGSRRRSRRT